MGMKWEMVGMKWEWCGIDVGDDSQNNGQEEDFVGLLSAGGCPSQEEESDS